jgi:hypothetical protein
MPVTSSFQLNVQTRQELSPSVAVSLSRMRFKKVAYVIVTRLVKINCLRLTEIPLNTGTNFANQCSPFMHPDNLR